MNRLRNKRAASSLKSPGKGASASSQEDPPPPLDDCDPLEEDPRRKPTPELDLQLVSDEARVQFADILGRVEGAKDVVIQQELMSLLDHVTPIGFLKR